MFQELFLQADIFSTSLFCLNSNIYLLLFVVVFVSNQSIQICSYNLLKTCLFHVITHAGVIKKKKKKPPSTKLVFIFLAKET